MSAEEAILQMELLNHNFFVFQDAEDMEVRVVYKRKKGDYGLIVPTRQINFKGVSQDAPFYFKFN